MGTLEAWLITVPTNSSAGGGQEGGLYVVVDLVVYLGDACSTALVCKVS